MKACFSSSLNWARSVEIASGVTVADIPGAKSISGEQEKLTYSEVAASFVASATFAFAA